MLNGQKKNIIIKLNHIRQYIRTNLIIDPTRVHDAVRNSFFFFLNGQFAINFLILGLRIY